MGEFTNVSRLLCLAWLTAVAAPAHDVITTKLTWSQEISRIVNRHCLSCHGSSAVVPLSTYAEARPWAKAIRDEVLNHRMPPWGAIKGYGDFRNDPSLSQDELNRIAEWVEGGVPEGDPQYLPTGAPQALPTSRPPPGRWSSTLQLGQPARLKAIRPLVSVKSAKVTAQKPDGSLIPLLWLREYNAEWRQVFVYREPIALPRGTRIVTTSPFRLELSLFPTH